jgi:hypothetical protein
MTRTCLLHWQGVVPPAGMIPRRKLPLPVGWRTEDPVLRDRYDAETLIYGGAWLVEQRLLRLYTPRPLNLLRELKSARYTAHGGSLSAPRIRQFKRYAMLDFLVDAPVTEVSVALGEWIGKMPIIASEPSLFARCNVLYTMSQDNDLDWIEDWVRYHHRAHGANALIISDNHSKSYSLEDLLEAMRGLGFLKAVAVLGVPYRYGPSSQICRRASGARYLQSATANFVRDIWLRQARAVLSCDIDELVISESGESVFDRACASRLGVVSFPGYWRFCDPAITAPRHVDHLFARADRAKPCPTKYAWSPKGPLGHWSLMTHCLEALPRQWASGAPDLWFAHCYGITTRWKVGREADVAALTPDSAINAAFLRAGLLNA